MVTLKTTTSPDERSNLWDLVFQFIPIYSNLCDLVFQSDKDPQDDPAPGPEEAPEAPEERAASPPRSQEEQQRIDEHRERKDAKKLRRNEMDRTNYHYQKMSILEIALAEAKRNGQSLIILDILEEMENVREGARNAG